MRRRTTLLAALLAAVIVAAPVLADWAAYKSNSILRMFEQAATPATVTNTGAVYTADVAGVTQLHYVDDGGNVRQITTTTAPVSGSGATDRVTLWSSASGLTSDTGLTFNTTTNDLTVVGAVLPQAGTFRDIEVAKCLVATGLTNVDVIHETFVKGATAVGWLQSNSGTGAHTSVTTTVRGGVVQQSTGANASSGSHTVLGAALTAPAFVLRADTEKWCIAARMKYTTTPDAVTLGGIGLINVANTRCIYLGPIGAQSTTVFKMGTDACAGTGGQYTSSTISIDTAWHTFRIQSRSGTTTLHFQVDDETAVSHAGTTYGTDSSLVWNQLYNQGTAAAQTVQVDEIIAVSGPN